MISKRLARHIHVQIFKLCETHDLKSLITYLKHLENQDLSKYIDWNCETDFGGFLEIASLNRSVDNLTLIRFLMQQGCDLNFSFSVYISWNKEYEEKL